MSFQFQWPTFSDQFHAEAKEMLNAALNRGAKPAVIADRIEVRELNMGMIPPELEILEIGDLTMDRFRGIFRLTYAGDAHLVLETKVQANPLNAAKPDLSAFPTRSNLFAASPLIVPMLLRLSSVRLRAIVVLVVSRAKGITLVFKNDPLENVDVSSTFDTIAVIQKFIQQEIEGQLREMFREDLPGIIHRLSQRWLSGEASKHKEGAGGKVETPYKDQKSPSTQAALPDTAYETMSLPEPGAAPGRPRAPASLPGGGRPSRLRPTETASALPGARPILSTTALDRLNAQNPTRFGRYAPSEPVVMRPARQLRRSSSSSSSSASMLARAENPSPPRTISSFTSFPDIENYDPTYGLRPDDLPTHSGYSGFGSLWKPDRGLLELTSKPDEASATKPDEDEDDDVYDLIDAADVPDLSIDPDYEPELFGYPAPASAFSPEGDSEVDADGLELPESVPYLPPRIEYETIPAVGGGTVTRPRVYHSQSLLRPIPSGTDDGGPAGSSGMAASELDGSTTVLGGAGCSTRRMGSNSGAGTPTLSRHGSRPDLDVSRPDGEWRRRPGVFPPTAAHPGLVRGQTNSTDQWSSSYVPREYSYLHHRRGRGGSASSRASSIYAGPLSASASTPSFNLARNPVGVGVRSIPNSRAPSPPPSTSRTLVTTTNDSSATTSRTSQSRRTSASASGGYPASTLATSIVPSDSVGRSGSGASSSWKPSESPPASNGLQIPGASRAGGGHGSDSGSFGNRSPPRNGLSSSPLGTFPYSRHFPSSSAGKHASTSSITLSPTALNDTAAHLATLSHSNHTLSPYTRSLEHFTVRSFPHVMLRTGTARARGGVASGTATPTGASGSPSSNKLGKPPRRRTFRLGGGGASGKDREGAQSASPSTRSPAPSTPPVSVGPPAPASASGRSWTRSSSGFGAFPRRTSYGASSSVISSKDDGSGDGMGKDKGKNYFSHRPSFSLSSASPRRLPSLSSSPAVASPASASASSFSFSQRSSSFYSPSPRAAASALSSSQSSPSIGLDGALGSVGNGKNSVRGGRGNDGGGSAKAERRKSGGAGRPVLSAMARQWESIREDSEE